MDHEGNKRGFFWAPDLTFDTQAIPQPQPRQTSPQPSVAKKTGVRHAGLTKWPALPALWSSVDVGRFSATWRRRSSIQRRAARQKEGPGYLTVTLLCIGISGLGADAHMRELGMTFMRETEGFDAHGCR